MSTIPEKILETSTVIKTGMNVKDDGVITIEPDAFNKALEGLGIDMAAVKAVNEQRDILYQSFVLATGEKGVEAMAAAPALKQVSAEQKFDEDLMTAAVNRSQEMGFGEGDSKTVFGTMRDGYTVKGAIKTKGTLKTIKSHVRSLAMDALGK